MPNLDDSRKQKKRAKDKSEEDATVVLDAQEMLHNCTGLCSCIVA
jgi:hypothetical protein